MKRALIGFSLVLLLLVAGCTPRTIWIEARNGNYNNVKKLLDEDPDLIDKPHYDSIKTDLDNRWTPLHYAVDHRHYRVVELLLERGADPLAKAHGGWTPYHRARGDRKMERIVREAILESGRSLP